MLFGEIGPADVYRRQTWVFLIVSALLVMMVFKLIIHLYTMFLTRKYLQRQDVINSAVLDMAKSYRELADSMNKDSRRTLAKMEETVQAGVTASLDVAHKLADSQPPSGQYPRPPGIDLLGDFK